MDNVVLVGMPLSGKSRIGRALGKRLGRNFVDTDEMIEKRCDMSINRIFAEHGEEYFRNIEREVIEELKMMNGCVISTGGGMVAYGSNLDELKKVGVTVFLNVSVDELYRRSRYSYKRPLLEGNAHEKLNELYERRIEIYKKCDIIIWAANYSVDENVKKIIRNMRRTRTHKRCNCICKCT